MAYFLDIFSPTTYEAFSNSDRSITGVRLRQRHAAERVKPGDKLICYLTKLSRWVGVLQVLSESFIDDTPRFTELEDPYVVRLRVRPIVWLSKEKAIPIREDRVWNTLSFTRVHDKSGSTWTGKFRSSLSAIDETDGKFLEGLIISQENNAEVYPVDEDEYHKYLTQRIHRVDRVVIVSVPEDATDHEVVEQEAEIIRDSIRIQAMLARIGERMGFSIWIPKNDRSRVLKKWQPVAGALLDRLPLNYDIVTLKTIEQIDVIWLRSRAIVRAFEIEHTTAVYSGLLRMADLLTFYYIQSQELANFQIQPDQDYCVYTNEIYADLSNKRWHPDNCGF